MDANCLKAIKAELPDDPTELAKLQQVVRVEFWETVSNQKTRHKVLIWYDLNQILNRRLLQPHAGAWICKGRFVREAYANKQARDAQIYFHSDHSTCDYTWVDSC